jgi:nucleoside phosphorylase/CheY-like chemotaxis protein
MPIRVLVVDDDQEKSSRIVDLLVTTGGVQRQAIDTSRTGVEARRSLAAAEYGLVVMDIALPLRPGDQPDRRGGVKLLEEIVERGVYKLPEMVVGLTAFPDLSVECAGFFNSRLWALETYDRADEGWAQRLAAKARYLVARSEQTQGNEYATDVCVIAALNTPELSALLALPWSWSTAISFDQVGFYFSGSTNCGTSHISVIAASAPRMGMVSTAILSVKMIAKFRPRILAMVGICGGVKGSCKIGDALVASPSWDWQTGKHTIKGLRIAPDQIPIETGVAEQFKELARQEQILAHIRSDFVGDRPAEIPSIYVAPVTCGSAVLGDGRLISEIKTKQHRNLKGVDMELYGMYAAVRDSPRPAPVALGIKAVCDYADGAKDDRYQGYAAHVSARVFASYIAAYGVRW